jgi:uncharacterized protein (TIGR03118 family)
VRHAKFDPAHSKEKAMKVSAKTLRPWIVACAVLLIPEVALAQHYKQTNLVSDIAALAPNHDPNLINPWGLSRSPFNAVTNSGTPWWVSDNGTGKTSLYDGAGANIPINGTGFVTIPLPEGSTAPNAAPTGTVFNGSGDFVLPNGNPGRFFFATEDGTISGWNGGTSAVIVVDNSDHGSAHGAVYKGLTIGEVNGQRFLYAANFRSGRVEVYNTHFMRVRLREDAFDDDDLPRGFAPFNVQNIGGTIFVTFAKQDAARHDDVAGDGLGFVDVFTPSGRLIARLQHGPWMNSPWGVVWTPRDFGEFSNAILVGNFGSGKIAAFNGFTYKFMGFLKNSGDDSVMTIDGLWAIAFGNNATAGPATTMFFTAGINHEADGLFGTITPVDGFDGDEQ